MRERELTALFALADVEAEPLLRPGFAEQTVKAARRSLRRRRVGGVLAAALTVLVAGTAPALLAGARTGGEPAAPNHHPSLPNQFAGYSVLTATVTRKPPGRAIALYIYGNDELFNTYQPLVVGADGDRYRRIDAMEARRTSANGYPEALLSPDGTNVLVGGSAMSLVLVDLTTGRTRELPVDPPVLGVRLLAWSPDGRYVAYGDALAAAGQTTHTLVVLDVVAGTSTRYSQPQPVRSASFAPDSRHLAVQLGGEAWIVTVDGHRERALALPEGRQLLARFAWSPDSALIGTVPDDTAQSPSCGSQPCSALPSGELTFVDSTGTGRPVPPPVDVGRATVLGWRSPNRLVGFEGGDAGIGGNIVEIASDTGERHVLSRFSDSTSCEYGSQQCQVEGLQLATALLPALVTRAAGDPDRGPWPSWLIHTCLALAALMSTLGFCTVRATRRQRLRRRRGRPAT